MTTPRPWYDTKTAALELGYRGRFARETVVEKIKLGLLKGWKAGREYRVYVDEVKRYKELHGKVT